ncbi:hypothetical protein ACS0TY_020694 [Phlomoides rotata]
MNVGGGDWMCAACQHINFKKRESCQRCSCPKYAAAAAEVCSYAPHRTEEVLAGDWYCSAMNCGSHNYASRTTCYRCGAYAAMSMASPAYDSVPGWKTGDWICNRLGCGMHNYASRTECYKCKTPRDGQLYANCSTY